MTSFNFQWKKSDSGSKSTVFGKRQKNKSEKIFSVNSTTKPVSAKKSHKKQKFTHKIKNKIKEIAKEPTAIHEIKNVRPGLVKRKQKKDKIAWKTSSEINIKKPTQSKNVSHSLFSERHKDIYVDTEVSGKAVVEKLFNSERKFSDLGIHKYIVSNLAKAGFINSTTVQEKSIPVTLSGKNMLIRSQTGSGKTLAYAVPILNALQSLQPRLQRSDGTQAIVIVPTRELALQTHELCSQINSFQFIVVGHLCGGENRKTEKDRLRKGVHILIATPGRLLDHILHTCALKTNNVRCLVLDEADRLLDMGFKKDIVRIVEELDKSKNNFDYNPMGLLKSTHDQNSDNKRNSIPEGDLEEENPLSNIQSKNRQTILLSATLTKGIAELADFTMKNHVYIDALDSSEENTEHMIIPDTVTQEFVMTFVKHRLFTLSAMLVAKSKENAKVFVFMATSHMVDYHYVLFKNYLFKMRKNKRKIKQTKSGDVVLMEETDSDSDGHEIALDTEIFKLHGSMDQATRKQVFSHFKKAKKGILICTDVVARGIDVPTADCIIQYTGPQTDEDYLHRVGRTGRAGKSGSAIIFLTHEEQEFITRLHDFKIFLKKKETGKFLAHLSNFMEEPNQDMACSALQRRYENAVSKSKELHRLACFAFSSWSRFYNTYPTKLKQIFNFKNVNLGHYVTSFALRDSPTSVSRVVRGNVAEIQPDGFNRNLDNTEERNVEKEEKSTTFKPKRKIKSISLTTSEFSSGLSPMKKAKKKAFNY